MPKDYIKNKIKEKLAGMADSTVRPIAKSSRKYEVDDDTKVPGIIATAQQTAASIKAPVNARAASYLAQIENSGLTDTEIVGSLPRTPENLPAVISKAMVISGANRIEPRWHMVRNLPGYMSSAIRAMGRSVFRPITSTPIEEIHVVSSLTNNDAEINYVAHWIRKKGKRDDHIKYKFEQLLQGYKAEVSVWKVEGYTFALVEDFMGRYIYGWPSK